MEDRQLLQIIKTAIDDKFGENIMILDIREISVIADYFILSTAKNSNQMTAISDEIEQKLAEQKVFIKHTEGSGTNWLLLDYSNFIINVFDEESRNYYNLERIWANAKKLDI